MAALEFPVFIQIDPNPNCPSLGGLVFQPQTKARAVSQLRTVRCGAEIWCSVTGVGDTGMPCPAMACLIEDSGDGVCHLVFGGAWGLRFKTNDRDWNLNDPDQWGEPYLILPGDASDLVFAPEMGA
jgi:hypothetical protein